VIDRQLPPDGSAKVAAVVAPGMHTKTRPEAGVNGRVSFPQRHSRPGAEARRDE
jgi:hypothetical protein